jgi:hypothetical protein
MGDLFLDLRHLRHAASATTVEASVGVGTLHVTLPRGARVELDARVGEGRIDPWAVSDVSAVQGFDQRMRRNLTRAERARPTAPIRLKADVGIGSIDIERGS